MTVCQLFQSILNLSPLNYLSYRLFSYNRLRIFQFLYISRPDFICFVGDSCFTSSSIVLIIFRVFFHRLIYILDKNVSDSVSSIYMFFVCSYESKKSLIGLSIFLLYFTKHFAHSVKTSSVNNDPVLLMLSFNIFFIICIC